MCWKLLDKVQTGVGNAQKVHLEEIVGDILASCNMNSACDGGSRGVNLGRVMLVEVDLDLRLNERLRCLGHYASCFDFEA